MSDHLERAVRMPFTGGLPETACGAGSRLASTMSVRGWLPGVLRSLAVRVLLDAPCGDCNWMARVDLAGIDYIGCDYDGEHLRMAWSRPSRPSGFAPRSKVYFERDIVSGALPNADVMLCRDFLQHLPNALVARVLRNFLDAQIPWLLATSHDNASNEEIATAGMFRPLNLTRAPFGLPPPRRHVEDEPGSGRILGLWHRDDLTETSQR